MDEPTLQRSLRARPPADPVYQARLAAHPPVPWRPAARPWTGRLLVFATLLAALLLAATALLVGTQPSPPPGPSGVFLPTGSMAEARSRHTATLLADGRVLVVGGGWRTTAELYDPGTEAWTPTGGMAMGRTSHSATLLPDGRLLVAGGLGMESDGSGGESSVALASAELYDPDTGAWTPTGSMAAARYDHTATLLPDGRVLVAGSFDVASAELFDPRTGTWTTTGDMIAARGFQTATLLRNGRVLVVGGFRGGQATAELYDPDTGRWTLTGRPSARRAGHAAVLLSDGTVLVVGGTGSDGSLFPVATAELYDPATETWTPVADMASERVYLAASLLPDGRVLVTGGSDARMEGGSMRAVRNSPAEVYDPVDKSWMAAGTLGKIRVLHTATLLTDGSVLITGGQHRPVSSGGTTTAELYVP